MRIQILILGFKGLICFLGCLSKVRTCQPDQSFRSSLLEKFVLKPAAYNPEGYNFFATLGFFSEPIKIYFLIWNY